MVRIPCRQRVGGTYMGCFRGCQSIIAHSVYAPLPQLSVPHEGYLCGRAMRSLWYVVAGGAMSHSKVIGPGPFLITHAVRLLWQQLEGALHTLPDACCSLCSYNLCFPPCAILRGEPLYRVLITFSLGPVLLPFGFCSSRRLMSAAFLVHSSCHGFHACLFQIVRSLR